MVGRRRCRCRLLNSRPCKEANAGKTCFARTSAPSTHAPRGANSVAATPSSFARSLQLTPPVWGRTTAKFNAGRSNLYFNSRPRVGANIVVLELKIVWMLPSTHAPVWGKSNSSSLVRLQLRLKLTPRVGANSGYAPATIHTYLLQLTPPCGGRTGSITQVHIIHGSPTHAPVWGRTCSKPVRLSSSRLQLTPPCGGEQQNCTNSNFKNSSITERLTTSLLFVLRRSITEHYFLQNYRFCRCEPD